VSQTEQQGLSNWIDTLVEGDLIGSVFPLSLASGIEGFDARHLYELDRKTIEITTEDALIVLGVETDRVLDRLTIICLAKGHPCQVVMMRYNVSRSFRLISHYDER